ncbi:hypothetical protein JOC76_001176 [Neobacillus cucumis]|nr:hypothetical protein [Neobacillus cucumis]
MMLSRTTYPAGAAEGTHMKTLYLNIMHSTRLEWIA